MNPPFLGRHRLLPVLLALLWACTGDDFPLQIHDCDRYQPTGTATDDPETCPAESCPVLCADSYCDSPDGSQYHCENCRDWAAYKESGDCELCEVLRDPSGGEWLGCGLQ